MSPRELMIVGLATGLLAVSAPAGQPKPAPCAAIRKAVWAGRTLEQVTAEYGTDAEHVMKCVQPKGKRRKPSKAGKGKSAPAKHAQPKTAGHTSGGASSPR